MLKLATNEMIPKAWAYIPMLSLYNLVVLATHLIFLSPDVLCGGGRENAVIWKKGKMYLG